ncbi:hypothetical protein [uncultured Brevundimonas sp.]|uniref:hypothetical protein n=1 Tax=uncultured Brevundimonas sp. TaxID=213418 RepID=UPI0025D50663|nr:hypothetical protein [uncultured Brevundimonas sp.]
MPKDRLVVIFGEDENDSRALAHLCHAVTKDETFDTKVIKRPPVLKRDAAPKKRQGMSQTIAAFADGLSKGRARVIVVAHRDCDAVEPAHVASSQELEADLQAAGVKHGVAATPAWEMETWWMVFPAALASARRCWRDVDYSNRAVGQIADSKERLTRDLRPQPAAARHRCPDFAESDGILVAESIRRFGIDAALSGTMPASLVEFRERLIKRLDLAQ